MNTTNSSNGAADVANTAIPGLDSVLWGGFPRDRLYLVEGDPGVGKTTLGLQFLLAGRARGETTLYITLAETRHELVAIAESHGWSLDGIHLFELSSIEERLRAASDQTVFHPSEVELGETVQALLAEVERVNPERVVFDSLSEIRLLARDPLRYRRQILALKSFFAGRRSTALLLDERATQIGDRQLQTLAHGVVQMDMLAPDYGAARRRLRLVKLRGAQFRSGYHDYTIRRGGLEVFPRLVAAEHRGGGLGEVVPSTVPELDQMLGGGLTRGTSTLIVGPAGSGKSTLASHFALWGAGRGEKVAIYTFDESINTFRDRNQGLGLDVTGHLESGRLLLRQIDPAELSPGEFAHIVQRAVEVDGATIVVIDSLNGYMSAMPQERFLGLHMHELLTFLGQRRVTTLLVCAQHGLTIAEMPPVDVSYLADTVLLLRYFESLGEIRKALTVVKKRSGAHETTVRELRIGPVGLSVSPPLKGFTGVMAEAPVYVGEDPGAHDAPA